MASRYEQKIMKMSKTYDWEYDSKKYQIFKIRCQMKTTMIVEILKNLNLHNVSLSHMLNKQIKFYKIMFNEVR